jgi:hypothetical protein
MLHLEGVDVNGDKRVEGISNKTLTTLGHSPVNLELYHIK